MNAKNRNRPPLGVFEDKKTVLKKPTSGNDKLPAKSAAPKKKTITKRLTNVEVGKIKILRKIVNKLTTAMNNNNEPTDEATNLSDVFDQTTIEFELSGNEPSILEDPVVLEIPEEDTSPEEHSTEPDQNIAEAAETNAESNAETNEDQLRYVFNTVEGRNFIIQGTSDGRVEMITPDQGGNQTPQRNSGSESGNEETVGKESTVLSNQTGSATGQKANNNDLSGNLNPSPEVSEMPVMEEHDTDQENANQLAWENRSANQKKYLETLEAGRTKRKLILRCMRHPGEIKIEKIPDRPRRHPGALTIESRTSEFPSFEKWYEITQKCLTDNAVVLLDRNDIPNWHRAQRKAKIDRNPTKFWFGGEDTDSDEDDEVKFIGTILKSKSKYGGKIADAGSSAVYPMDKTKVASKTYGNKCNCGEHTTDIGETECSNCRRQFLTLKDLQDHLAEIGQVCHEPGCQDKYGPRPIKRRRVDLNLIFMDETPVYSDVTAPWPKFLPKSFRCLVDIPKLDLSNEAQEVIKEKGLNLKLYTPEYREYYIKRLPVLVKGYDPPDQTDEEGDAEPVENLQRGCSLEDPCGTCRTCKKTKKTVLRPSSEETEAETSYLSSELDTDWDDPHNGEHPNCDECAEMRLDMDEPENSEETSSLNSEDMEMLKTTTNIEESIVRKPGNDSSIKQRLRQNPSPSKRYICESRFNPVIDSDRDRSSSPKCEWESDGTDFCEDPECTEHGKGDKEAEEEPPEINANNVDESGRLNPEVAGKLIEAIERLQRDSGKASGLAKNAMRDLQATNETTEAIRNRMEGEMIKRAETYRKISLDLEGTGWTHHHRPPGKAKESVCMGESGRRINCNCSPIEKEKSRAKINQAVQGLKDAIQTQTRGTGETIKSGNKTYVNCRKSHGQKLLVILRYTVTLPGIGEEVQEIWRNVRDSYNVITRKDLITVSCILSRYADEVEDGLLVEHDRAMYSADIDFYEQSVNDNLGRPAETMIRDDIIDDFSTDEDPIEILNATSRAYGEATGARPRTGQPPDKQGHYTKEIEDRKFKQEINRRYELEALRARNREKREEYEKKMTDWEENRWKEIIGLAEATMDSLRTKADRLTHDLERKEARSARRAAIHSRPRNREKIKIPAPPGDYNNSSETYYTSTTEISDTSSDSIPEIVDPGNNNQSARDQNM